MKKQKRSFLVSLIILILALNMFCFLHFVPLIQATSVAYEIDNDANGSEISAGDDTAYINAWYGNGSEAPSSGHNASRFGVSYVLGSWDFARTFLRFDTADLPDSATVTSAKLCLYGSLDQSATDFTIRLQLWTRGYLGLAPSASLDFLAFDGVNYDDGTFSTSSFTTSGYNNITISNFDLVNKTGSTCIAVRSSRDIAQTAASGLEMVEVEDAGDVHHMRLEIEYSEGSTVEEDYVDSQTDVDSHADHGTHSNFASQKASDWVNDTLTEANTNTTLVNNSENFVDSNTSNIDSHTGHGTSSNFTAQQDALIAYNDTLTEVDTGGAPLTITFRAAGAEATGTGAVTPALPTGRTNGDIMILVATTIVAGTITITATGSVTTWTAITGSPIDVTGGEKLYVWWGRYTSGTTGPTVTPASDHIEAGIAAWYNCIASGDPIDVSQTGTETTSDTSFSFATSISTSANAEMCIAICTTGQDIATNGRFSTMTDGSLTSLAERMDYCTSSGGGGGFALDEGYKATAGVVGTWASTLLIASAKAYISFALKPAFAANYEFDYEFSWTTASFSEGNEYLCIRANTFTGTAENLGVDVWDGSWKSISNALTASQWNNFSISTNLTGTTIYFRFIGKTESSDTAQNTWKIECSLLHTWSNPIPNYELDLEEQFTSANFSRTSAELCIRMGVMDGEALSVQWWNGSSWVTIIVELLADQWNNISVHLTSGTFTIKFVGGVESGDISQSVWNIDSCLLYSWDVLSIIPVGNSYQFNSTVGDEVIIGDPLDTAFHPKFTMNRWGSECFFKLSFNDSGHSGVISGTQNNAVWWNISTYQFQYCPIYSGRERIANGLEFVIMLNQRVSVFNFSIQSQDLVFYYQPALDHELNVSEYDSVNATHAVKNGEVMVYRPENVVGSYAVYHSSKTNNKYGSGKAFHIYRPTLVDAVGNKAWADLNIETGILTMTLPTAFLDTATYPIRLGGSSANFGYETAGPSSAAISSSLTELITGSIFTAPADVDTATNVSAALKRAATGSNNVNMAIYLHSDLSKKAQGTSTSTAMTTTLTYYTFHLASHPTLTASADYLLAAWADYTTKTISMGYDTGSENQGHSDSDDTAYSETFPDPFGTVVHGTNKWSIYCTYEVKAGGQNLAFNLANNIIIAGYNQIVKGLAFQITSPFIPTSIGYFCKSLPFQVTGAINFFESTSIYKALAFLVAGIGNFFSSFSKGMSLSFQPSVSAVPSSSNYFTKAIGFQATNTFQSFGSITMQKALGFLTSGVSNLFASLSKAVGLSFQASNTIIPSTTSYLSKAMGFQTSATLIISSANYFWKALGFQATDMLRAFDSTSMLKGLGFLSTELSNIFSYNAMSKEVGFQVLEVQRAENIFPLATSYFWKAIGFQPTNTINIYDALGVGKGLGFLTSGTVNVFSTLLKGMSLTFQSSGSVRLWDSSSMLKGLGFETSVTARLFDSSIMLKGLGYLATNTINIFDSASMLKALGFQSANTILPSSTGYFWKAIGLQPTATIRAYDSSVMQKAIGFLSVGTTNFFSSILRGIELGFIPSGILYPFAYGSSGKETATILVDRFELAKLFANVEMLKALGFQTTGSLNLFDSSMMSKAIGLLTSGTINFYDVSTLLKAKGFLEVNNINVFAGFQVAKEQLFTILNVFQYEPIYPSASLFENKAIQFSVLGEIAKLFSSLSSNLGREFFNYDLIHPLAFTSQSRGLQFGLDGLIRVFSDSPMGKAISFLATGTSNIWSSILKGIGLAFQPSGIVKLWDSNVMLKALGFQVNGATKIYDSSIMLKALGFSITDVLKIVDSLSSSFEIYQYIPQNFYFTLTNIVKMFSGISFNMAKGFSNYDVIHPSGSLIQNKAIGFNVDGVLRLFSDMSISVEKAFSNFGTINPLSYLAMNKALGFNTYELPLFFDYLGMNKGIRITIFEFFNTEPLHLSSMLTMNKALFIAFTQTLFGTLNINSFMIPIGQIVIVPSVPASNFWKILAMFSIIMLMVSGVFLAEKQQKKTKQSQNLEYQ